jgi:hypothetical protein
MIQRLPWFDVVAFDSKWSLLESQTDEKGKIRHHTVRTFVFLAFGVWITNSHMTESKPHLSYRDFV